MRNGNCFRIIAVVIFLSLNGCLPNQDDNSGKVQCLVDQETHLCTNSNTYSQLPSCADSEYTSSIDFDGDGTTDFELTMITDSRGIYSTNLAAAQGIQTISLYFTQLRSGSDFSGAASYPYWVGGSCASGVCPAKYGSTSIANGSVFLMRNSGGTFTKIEKIDSTPSNNSVWVENGQVTSYHYMDGIHFRWSRSNWNGEFCD